MSESINLFPTRRTTHGKILAQFELCFIALAMMANDCALLMFHLGNYCIAHHIRLLRIQLTNTKRMDTPRRGCKKVLHYLHKASVAIGSLFSMPVLVTLVSQLLIISLNLFGIIFIVVRTKKEYTTTGLPFVVFTLIASLVRVITVLHAADMPVHQVIRLVLGFL